MILVEACVDSVDSALAAERGGAGRLELCDNLYDGGTTPSAGMIAAVVAQTRLPVFVIVRPRGGGFVYSASEIDVMRRDVAAARGLGAAGIVIGSLTRDAVIDEPTTRALVAAAGPLPVTFHRAFDLTRDLEDSLETLLHCGVTRVLTSGGASTALEGAHRLAALVARARGRLTIVAGGGIREENVVGVVQGSGVREIHVRGTRLESVAMSSGLPQISLRKPFPADEGAWEATDERRIREFVRLVREVEVSPANVPH
jgi:copper homeostasis protein